MRALTKVLLIFLPPMLFSQQQDTTALGTPVNLSEVVLEAKVIFGSKFAAKNRTGSSYYISPEEIQKFNYTDVSRVLRSVPGVNVVEEDGFGLRPNISLRGTSPERSSKITVMEDGVLIAPAPYSAPAAYYFPTIARMQSVEVLKGSSQVQYGPYTTGGAINMLSTEVPETFGAFLNASYGSFQSSRLHTQLGDSRKNFGYAVEYLNYSSDGFKILDGGGDTGFNKNDLVAKFRLNTSPEAAIQQALEFKFQYSDERSDETYLGLTQSDFEATPLRRYAGSQQDLMSTDHVQFTISHTLDLSENFRISTTGYRNDFNRNWYKLDYLTLDGAREGIADILEDPETFDSYYQVVSGSADSPADALSLKNNNREYLSTGIQTKLDLHWTGRKTFHDIEVGLRYHYDEEDRYQWLDDYAMQNGQLLLTTEGIPGTDANRISDARAFAAYTMYKFKINDLTLTPGLRYENMTLGRVNYGNADPDRTGADLSTRENKVDIFIPGIGFNYNFQNLSLFGGVHKGFAPPGSEEGQNPEESINYEIGTRFSFGDFAGELVGFFNDYSNLLGSDLAASGGTGSLDQFNAGAVNVGGVELLLNYNLLQGNSKFDLPITFSYTYTDTAFQSDFGSDEDLWGEVSVGDEMPYISKHLWNAGLSLEHDKFELNVNARFTGEFRTQAGQGPIPDGEKVASNFILDFAGKYHAGKHLSLTANIINLLDETYLVSRVPAGLRPGHPFGAFAGLQLRY
ncbi:TonB-dependent receptor family protein [Robiginitalea aurantiaca]|uniref:TonB-dependent receptor n=1 Tax=Robiginitalea aurantiaca TaxID=3056915 RepID=A0ABT7WD19_9FLAO|nr:TonB-dependent receptor [Robiginitalea aurantiaca]MDM9630809.1 TonB-dependent receptor [Robiginitalea aurantiaca]